MLPVTSQPHFGSSDSISEVRRQARVLGWLGGKGIIYIKRVFQFVLFFDNILNIKLGDLDQKCSANFDIG